MTTITEEATEAVRVRDLEWEEREPTRSTPHKYWRAQTTFDWGYRVYLEGGLYRLQDEPEKFSDLASAKAAAQADYEARIRSALVAPQAEGRDTGLPYAFITCNSEIDKFYVSIKTQTLADAQRWHDAVLGLARALSPKEPE